MSNTAVIGWPNTRPTSTPVDAFVGWLKKGKELATAPLIDNYSFDKFSYPPLTQLRKEFEETGLYTNEQLDVIMKSYERLPKYQSGSGNTSRGKKRS